MGRAAEGGGKGRNAAAAPAPEGARRSFVTLPLAQLLPGITRPAYRKRSPAGAVVMAEWAAIVGARLAAVTEPRRLARGQLTIACAGPVAMELQHLQSALLDRINTHAGQALVEKLRFVQDHVASRPPPPVALRRGAAFALPDLPEGVLGEALAGLWVAFGNEQEKTGG